MAEGTKKLFLSKNFVTNVSNLAEFYHPCILNLSTQREDQHPGFSETDGEKTKGAQRHVRPGEEPTC